MAPRLVEHLTALRAAGVPLSPLDPEPVPARLAEVSEALWRELKGPVRRLAGPRSPVPYAEPLENLFRIAPDDVVRSALKMTRED